MSRARTVPVILISGIEEEPMASAAIAMQWDLPHAVSVHHVVDPEREVLWRIVSDASGVVERTEIDLEHACVSCAIREDVVPTLERLGAEGRWETIVAQLPVTAEAVQVCRVIGWAPSNVPHIRISASVVALSADQVLDDLLGDDLVNERDLPVRADDSRGVAEVACAMVEYADVVAVGDDLDRDEREILVALARPGVPVVESFSRVDAAQLGGGVHHHRRSEAWVSEVRRYELPQHELADAWVLDVESGRPFHPERLNDTIAVLGGGPRRSRGCFWLPSRPGQICVWDGAGGQLSVGTTETWGAQTPLTRITVVGLDDGRDELERAFASCVLTDAEMHERGPYWEVIEDGFEAWLGPIHRAA
jgi:G3E family GTPase